MNQDECCLAFPKWCEILHEDYVLYKTQNPFIKASSHTGVAYPDSVTWWPSLLTVRLTANLASEDVGSAMFFNFALCSEGKKASHKEDIWATNLLWGSVP